MNLQRQVWKLRRRPEGAIKPGDLELVAEPVPDLKDRQVLVAVHLVSLDPTNRIWMSTAEQYMPPVALDDGMRGGICGTVIASRSPQFTEGMLVSGLGEWATHVTVPEEYIMPLSVPDGMAVATWFGSLGGTGWTAYFGLHDICQPKSGETLVVSAAAGAVGSLVGQMAKIAGARVLGIAGGAEKCRYLTEQLGFDCAIDYKARDVGSELDRIAPDGIDMNFENVGGPVMTAVASRLRLFGRMALCGTISTYNCIDPIEEPGLWSTILMRRLKIRGFIVSDFAHRFDEASDQMARWHAEERLKTREDVRSGIENAVTAVSDLYSGGNNGKLLLKVD
jgi:NADPH-dependent curcumin reductase